MSTEEEKAWEWLEQSRQNVRSVQAREQEYDGELIDTRSTLHDACDSWQDTVSSEEIEEETS